MKYMKYIKYYESKGNIRKVYWITPFDKMEDTTVKLALQYKSYNDTHEKINIIDSALSIAQEFKEDSKKQDLVLVTMEFEFEGDELVSGPFFQIHDFDDKNSLESDNFIYVGLYNISKEDYNLFLAQRKFNL